MLIRNIFSNWAGLVITGAISFLLTPILIHGLGDFYYGMWILSMSILDYYGLLDLGIRTTLHRYVSRLKGANERQALNDTFATSLAIACAIGVLVTLLTLPLMSLLPSFFSLQGSARNLLEWLALLLGLSVGILFPARVFGAYLCGLQRFDLYNFGVISTAILRALFIIVVLRIGFGVLGVASVGLGIAVLTLLLNWRLVRFAEPTASLDLRRTNWARVRELMSFSFFAFLNTVGDYLRFYTDSAVIGRMLSITLVTPFSVVGRLMSYFKELSLGLCGPQMPRMSELEGQGRENDLRQFFLRATKLSTLFSLLIGALLLVDGKDILRLWLGQRFVGSYNLLVALTIGYMPALAQWPSRDLLYAKGRPQPLGWWTLIEGAANLLLSVYWARRYGLIGVALGTTVPMLLVGLFVQPIYALKMVRIPIVQYAKKALVRPLLGCMAFIAICRCISAWWTPAGLSGFLLVLASQSALLALLSYVIVFTSDERRSVVQRSKYVGGLVLHFARTEVL